MEDLSTEINRKRTTHDTLSLTIKGEGHILGNVLQKHLALRNEIEYAGYRKHHPLIDEIELKVKICEDAPPAPPTSRHVVIPIIKDTIMEIVKDVNVLLEQIESV